MNEATSGHIVRQTGGGAGAGAGPLLLAMAAAAAGCGLSVIPREQPSTGGGSPPPGQTWQNDGGLEVTGPPSGAVVIGGRAVPRDKVIVFLHIGHSNMAGRAETPASERGFHYDTHPQLWAYAGGGMFRPAREPLSPDSMTSGRAGPGMSILRAALALAPDAMMVSIGHGHSGQTGGYCRNFRKGGLLYDLVMAPAMELRGRVTFGAVFTMFSISESQDRPGNATFGECMEAVARDMRADLGEPGLPFANGDWEPVRQTESTGMVIVPQLRMLPARIPRSVLIPTEGLPIEEGDHHYTLTGHKLWAERGFTELGKAGLLEWARR
jgi:hypothetical protein